VERGQLLFEELPGDFIQRAGRDFGGNAQFLGLGKDLLAFDAKSLCDVVYTNGHTSVPANWAAKVSWL
jgi:hypothetical protein